LAPDADAGLSARDVAILVPRGGDLELTDSERLSLRHLDEILPGYDRYLVRPRSARSSLAGFEVKPFADRFFETYERYQALCLSRQFYEAFRDYQYILIYQLDALVFSDRLLEWCATGIDYIGAPWVGCPWPDRVGNGGFSLRRVEGFLSVLDSPSYWIEPKEYWRRHWSRRSTLVRVANWPRRELKRIRRFNSARQAPNLWRANEDVFWSYKAEQLWPPFRRASVEEGLRFAFETSPRKCFELTDGELPFGCHAWERYDPDFWRPFLLKR